jgi:hypothetical protein
MTPGLFIVFPFAPPGIKALHRQFINFAVGLRGWQLFSHEMREAFDIGHD